MSKPSIAPLLEEFILPYNESFAPITRALVKVAIAAEQTNCGGLCIGNGKSIALRFALAHLREVLGVDAAPDAKASAGLRSEKEVPHA